jgi:hypothetical protein
MTNVHSRGCRKSLLLLLLAFSSPLSAAEEAWQSNAKGLCEGPLCSPELRVRIGKTLDLFIPNGSMDTGWNTLGPVDVPLGSIGVPSTLAVTNVERTGDWSHSKAVVTLDGGAKLTLYASQLSTALVVETSTDKLRLFAGQHERFVTFDDKGKMRIHGHMGGNRAPKGAVTPRSLAVARGNTLEVCGTDKAMGVPSAADPWALVWWGTSSHFVRTTCPVSGTGVHSDAVHADFPLFLCFDVPPSSFAPAEGGGLDLRFRDAGRRVAVVPAVGHSDLCARAGEMDRAVGRNPDLFVELGRRLLPLCRSYPLTARERFR